MRLARFYGEHRRAGLLRPLEALDRLSQSGRDPWPSECPAQIPANDADAISRCLWRQRHGQVHAGRKIQGRLCAERRRSAPWAEDKIAGCGIGGSTERAAALRADPRVIGAPQNPRATIVELERTAVRLLGDLGVQVLILDEIHNVLAASWREQRVVFNTLRYLSNGTEAVARVLWNQWRHGKRSMATCNWLVASMPFLCLDGQRGKSSAARACHHPQLAIERAERSDRERPLQHGKAIQRENFVGYIFSS